MRIDKFLTEKFGSRTKAARAVKDGLVLVNGKKVDVSYEIKESDSLDFLKPEESYVSLGGYKLSKALKDFKFSVKNMIFADIGASTGGFTDCLLQNGAKKVYCIDVGESQLDKSLIGEKIKVIDNFNARELTSDIFGEQPDGVVIDVSFISLTYILSNVAEVLKDGGYCIALIKPQFECDDRHVGKGGIVSGAQQHKSAIIKICDYARGCGLAPLKLTNAPIVKSKNKEYLVLLKKGGAAEINEKMIKSVKL